MARAEGIFITSEPGVISLGRSLSTIMPNHVHVLLLPKTSLPVILRWLKGSTARRANLILGRTGKAFWQDESFDHCVRDEAELDRLFAMSSTTRSALAWQRIPVPGVEDMQAAQNFYM